jgi:hypothetical protein
VNIEAGGQAAIGVMMWWDECQKRTMTSLQRLNGLT